MKAINNSKMIITFLISIWMLQTTDCALNCKAASGTTATLNPITIVNLPKSKLPTDYDAKGLQPFFNLAKSFMNTVQSDSFSKLKDFDTNDFTSSANIDLMRDYELSILIAAAFGLLFAIFMPIVGCCFCCCRCCGKCGGNKSQSSKAAERHSCCCFMGVLQLLVAVFMLCGVLFMFVTNNRLHDAVRNTGTTYEEAINEAVLYANATVQELLSIPDEQIPCITDLVTNDLGDHGVNQLIGTKIHQLVQANLSTAIALALVGAQNITITSGYLKQVDASSTALKSLATDLKNEINAIKTDIDTAVTECRTAAGASPGISDSCDQLEATKNEITSNVDYTQFPDISTELNKIQDVIDLNLTGQIGTAQKTIDDIPQTVIDKSKSNRNDIIQTINDMKVTIKDEVEKLTKDIDKEIVNKKSEFLKYKKDYLDPGSDEFKYEDYRWYAYIGLSSVMALVVVFIGIGLTCGTCGYRKDRQPSHRTSIANHGGNCLMASVGFMFIFSWLFMLFCVLWFTVGIHLHIGCRDMKDGTLIDEFQDIKYDGEILKVGEILENCRNNMPIYTALNGVRFFNISEKFDIKAQTSDFDVKAKDIKVDLSDQQVLTPDAKKALQDMQNTGVDAIDFTKFFTTLSSKLTEADLNKVIVNLTQLSQDVQLASPSLSTAINNIKSKVETLQSGTVSQIQTNITKLDGEVKTLQNMAVILQTNAAEILKELTASEAYIQIEIQPAVSKFILDYVARLIGWLTQGTAHLINQMQTNLAKCKPIATLYDGLLNTFVCDNLVQNANGFWLALGWCLLFFIPAIILSVRLAKYFRKMDYDTGHEEIIEHPPYNDKIPLHSITHHPYSPEHFSSRPSNQQGPRSYDNNAAPPPYEGYQHQ